MRFACLLALTFAATPQPGWGEIPDDAPAAPLAAASPGPTSPNDEYVRVTHECESATPFWPAERDERDQAVASAAVRSPWLSPRERWCRTHGVRNTVEWLDLMTLHADVAGKLENHPVFYQGSDFGAAQGQWKPSRWCGSNAQRLAHTEAFAPPLLASVRIRTSELPPLEKGRRIAKLVKPWMTRDQIHALFGESESIIWDIETLCTTYVDYGVSVDHDNRVICCGDAKKAKGIAWDCFTLLEVEEYRVRMAAKRDKDVFKCFMGSKTR